MRNLLLYNKISFLSLSLAILQFSACSRKNQGNQDISRPNMIVIVADDLGWKDVGYHDSEIKTPVLDRIADQGAVFKKFYVHSVCSPSRASLLTGRMPTRFGIYAPLGDEAGIPPGTMTIAELLRQNGYETAISGKWHLGAVPEARPLNYGFISSYGYLRGQIDPYTHLYKNGNRTWHCNDSLIDEEGHATDLITNEAIRVIEKPREKDKPFFLYLAFSVPHFPLDEPEEWVDPYVNSIENESRRKFAAAVTHMDHAIGKVLSAVHQKELDENTLILFFSDNGAQEHWYPKSEYAGKYKVHNVLGNNLPLRDWKTSPYDGALRVPALLYWPGKVRNQEIKASVNVADVFPTLARLAGAKVKEEWIIEGLDFWPAFEGKELPERTMYWRSKNSIALKKGDWKLVHHGETLEDGTDELYNISADPYEEKDVAAGNQAKVEELRNDMAREMKLDKPAKPEASM
jgi:arylsulfatase A-like enzyme